MVGFGVSKWRGMEWIKGDLNMKIRDEDDDDGIVYNVCLLVIMITYFIYLDVCMFIPS